MDQIGAESGTCDRLDLRGHHDGEYVCVDDTEEKLVKAVETLWHGDWYAFAREYFEAERRFYRQNAISSTF